MHHKILQRGTTPKKKTHNKLSAIILSIRLSLTGPEDHTFPRKKDLEFPGNVHI